MTRGRNFLDLHRPVLDSAFQETGIAPTTVASIVWIETNFGTYTGKFHTLNSLTSLAALFLPRVQKRTAEQSKALAKEESEEMERDNGWREVDWENRTKEIGAKWYEELKSYLRLCKQLDWDPHEMKGSWAGAIGYGQFLPSTLLSLIGDRKVDIWNWNDMLPLIAKHLSELGWTEKGSDQEKGSAIQRYNAPRAYLDSVLEMKSRLEQTEATP